MKTIKKIVALGTILTALGLAPRLATADSLELNPAHQSTTLDLKVGGSLPFGANFFVRSRTSVDYDNKINPFLLTDLSYNMLGNADIVLEAQAAPDSGLTPRAGIQYAQDLGPFSLYSLITESAQSNPNTELTLMANFTTPITKKVSFYTGIEEVTNFDHKHNFSIQRLHSGLKIDNYTFGAAVDLMETSENSYNLGGFVRVNF